MITDLPINKADGAEIPANVRKKSCFDKMTNCVYHALINRKFSNTLKVQASRSNR